MGGIMHAKAFAATKHDGQKDDDGNDYYMHHLVPVADAISILTNNEEIIIAALLHDTLEDTDTTYEELVEHFGKRVADLVNEVTHEGTNDSKGYYFPRLKTADGILIKLIDRASNISRMNSWATGRKKQYLKRTKFWRSE